MWCERILGNVDEQPLGAEGTVDMVNVDWNDRGPVLKTHSRNNESICILLPAGQQLRHGDILFQDENRTFVVEVRRCEVIVARPADAQGLARLALELGNLHWPTEVGFGELIFPEEDTAMKVLEKLGIPWSREMRRFEPVSVSSGPTTLRVSQQLQVFRSSARSV